MNDLQPLMSLLQQAEQERDAALANQSRLMANLQAIRSQSQQLLTYREEYEQRWSEQFQARGGIEVMRCYQSFNERIHQALGHQQRSEAHAEQQLHAAQARAMSCEMRVASVKKIIDRRVSEQAKLADRQEQKITDEYAARSAWKSSDQLPNSAY